MYALLNTIFKGKMFISDDIYGIINTRIKYTLIMV